MAPFYNQPKTQAVQISLSYRPSLRHPVKLVSYHSQLIVNKTQTPSFPFPLMWITKNYFLTPPAFPPTTYCYNCAPLVAYCLARYLHTDLRYSTGAGNDFFHLLKVSRGPLGAHYFWREFVEKQTPAAPHRERYLCTRFPGLFFSHCKCTRLWKFSLLCQLWEYFYIRENSGWGPGSTSPGTPRRRLSHQSSKAEV